MLQELFFLNSIQDAQGQNSNSHDLLSRKSWLRADVKFAFEGSQMKRCLKTEAAAGRGLCS